MELQPYKAEDLFEWVTHKGYDFLIYLILVGAYKAISGNTMNMMMATTLATKKGTTPLKMTRSGASLAIPFIMSFRYFSSQEVFLFKLIK